MTAMEKVLKVYPAAMATSWGKSYRIIRPKTETDKPSKRANVILTRLYDTEEEAWKAAVAKITR
jgi:hypothetical protein